MTSEVRVRMRRDYVAYRSYFSGPALSALSQFAGAVQLVLVLVRVGANNDTDSFFYFWNLGMIPISTLVMGVLYPMLVNNSRVSARFLTVLLSVSSLACVSLVGVALWWFWLSGRSAGSVVWIAILMCALMLVQTVVWYRAVVWAAQGNPNWLAAVALGPNCCAVVALVLPLTDFSLICGMVVGLIVGNVGTAIWMVRRGGNLFAMDSVHLSTTANLGSGAWFLARSGIGQVGLALIQSTAVLLPPSQLTISTVVVKLVGSGVMTFANALLPRFLHMGSESSAGANRLMRILWLFWLGVGAVGVVVTWLLAPELFAVASVAVLWLFASSTALIAQRVAFRFLPARASLIPIASVTLVTIGAMVFASLGLLDILWLLTFYALIEAVSGLALLYVLRDRLAFVVMAAVTIAMLCVAAAGS